MGGGTNEAFSIKTLRHALKYGGDSFFPTDVIWNSYFLDVFEVSYFVNFGSTEEKRVVNDK